MNKDQAVFLLSGILFGLVCGYIAAFQIHRPSPAAAFSSMGPTHDAAAPAGGGAATGAAPGPQGEVLMEQVRGRIADLRGRLEANPRDLEALISLGNMYSDAGKFDESIQYYSRALEVNPDNPDVLSDLGVGYRNSGDPKRAIEMFRKALQAHPDHWQSWLNISIVAMFDLGDLAQAQDALSRAEALQPDLPNLKALRDHLQHLRQEGSGPGKS